ncbi:MAG: undecaprenyldiphospho-muramoylpentapeptide beta-N-acetylglucosaminyltransferase [Ruminococcaceae bacterium]|nr:undecaprenyldiphospho-muramoylpentapeptide beta-N-acetylglucosaminyltransferase [Oscillospiraceae bacterium]
MKIILTCGGTGGHITPALAIADIIKENFPRAEILFVGGERGMEKDMVSKAGYRIELLDVEGLSRKLTLHNFQVIKKAIGAVATAKALLKGFDPDLVIGTGGYACYPTLRAAVSLGIPCAVHESNACPGLAVKRLSGGVDRVWLNFAAAKQGLSPKAKVRVVGNPLPRGIFEGKEKSVSPKDKRKAVLSFGGSLGADAMNRAILDLMEREREMADVYHLHATGHRSYQAVLADFEKRGLSQCSRLSLVPFIEDMPSQMAAADLVICRAGAMSISELAAIGVAAVLIPSPNVTGNHQYKNAKMLADAGAAKLIAESALDETFTMSVIALLEDAPQRERMAKAIATFARKDANRQIFEDMKALTRK